MQEALPILIMLGVVIVALTFILFGIFFNARSRNKPDEADAPLNIQAPAESFDTLTAPPSGFVRFQCESDGILSVEIDGRRFTRLDDIRDDRLVQRVLAAVKEVQRFAGITPSASSLARSELSDELRAGHAPADRTLVVEFRGERFRQLTDVRDGETGRQLLAMIGELAAFAQGRGLPALPTALAGESGGLSEDAFLKRLTAYPPAPAPLKLPTLVESLRRSTSKPEPMPIGIAGQIEKVLQEQLVDNATLRGRSIHVTTAPDGSLVVDVEGQLLRWPDQVLDPSVREAVQRAIRIWERT